MIRLLLSFLTLLMVFNTGCYSVKDELHPQFNVIVQDRHLKNLPSPFPDLTADNQNQEWVKEYKIGMGFAHELDLYQALTAFKRSSFLLDSSQEKNLPKLNYYMMLCYYLGQKYSDVIHLFEAPSSILPYTMTDLVSSQDILVMLYDSYFHLKNTVKSEQVLDYIEITYPELHQKIYISDSLMKGDIKKLAEYSSTHPEIDGLLYNYSKEKKSPFLAQTLNAIIPGSGYLYLGQTQSAVTAFLVNGLCTWASIYCFQNHNIATGAIFASIEAGWYFGGIYGAGLEAKLYNERIYEKHGIPVIHEKKYLPILMLKYGF